MGALAGLSRKEVGQQGKTTRLNCRLEKRQLGSVSGPWHMHFLNRYVY
jgi:hypothetical protein